jgi:hypothetical protein
MTRAHFGRIVRLTLTLALINVAIGLFGGCGSGEGEGHAAAIKKLPGPADHTNSKVKKS